MDADPRVTFELTQTGATFTGDRFASQNAGFIPQAPAFGTVTNPTNITLQITSSSQGITSTCEYQVSTDASVDRIEIERTVSGFWCGQTSYTISRQQ